MKKLNVSLLAIATFGLFAFTACQNNSKVEEAREDVREAQEEVREEGEEVQEILQKESAELKEDIRDAQTKVDKRLAELRKDMNDASADAKVKINQQIERLETKRVQLGTELDRVGENMSTGWENFKMNVRKTLDDVEEDIDGDGDM